MPLSEVRKIDKAAYAVSIVTAAGEKSGYYTCLRGHINPYLQGAMQSGVTVFDTPGSREVVVAAQDQCEWIWPSFVTTLREQAVAGGFDDDIDETEIRTLVREGWTEAIVSKSSL